MAFTVDQAFDLLNRSFEGGRLAHAYLLHGPHREDLLELCRRLVNRVNGWKCPTFEDLALKGALVAEPEGKLRQIKVNSLRHIEQRFYVTSDMPWKIGIIVDAERQNQAAANAFLKTLEEPPPQTLILELSTQPEQLLQTVRSRCIAVALFRQGSGDASLREDETQLFDRLASYFQKTPSPAAAMIFAKQFLDQLAEVRAQIEKEHKDAYKAEKAEYGDSTDGSWIKEREDHYEQLTESAYAEGRARLVNALALWMGELIRRKAQSPSRELISWSHSIDFASQSMSFTALQRRLKAVEDLRACLNTNARDALAVEVYLQKAFS
jgi:DNA polymerase-3 subunit delta'